MQEVYGNTLGLKQSQVHHLRRTYRRRVDSDSIVSPELARHLTEVSRETNRQVGVLLDRKGDVQAVVVGDARKLELPDVGRARAGSHRLRGLRLVHTHLQGEPLTRDDHTDLALLRLDLVAALEVKEDGLPGKVHYAHLLPENPQGAMWKDEQASGVHDLAWDPLAGALALEEEFARARAVRRTGGAERAILVGFGGKARSRALAEASLEELRELARTAGVEVLEATLQLRRDPDPRYLIGKGKLEDIVLRSMQRMATMIVFDAELSPSQARHIAEATSLKILDRTQLILDIFAQRAQSADGKLQVELAQLKYLYPRLVGRDDSLSRLAGGIGGRGPGETKLEIDRRRVRDRITALERRIEALGADRHLRRKQRNERGLPVLSIVGYTNAGKSTLLNALTDSRVLAEDILFATLDPTSRLTTEDAPFILELLNEPFGKLTPDLWNEYLKEGLAVVRATNPTRVVVLGGGRWNSIDGLQTLALPEDDRNLIATVHYYTPMEFTHQGAPWNEENKDKSGVPWIGTDQERRRIELDFARAQQWATAHDRPLLLGEFGAYDKAPMDSRARYTAAVARAAEKLGWSWAYWQFDSDFVLWDMKRDAWVEPILHALIPQRK